MSLLRDDIQDPVSLDYFQQRLSAGWKLKAIEWEREDSASQPAPERQETPSVPSPYGLELVPESARLRESPEETAVMSTVLELIVVEKGVTHIADELNARGYKTRHGSLWTPTAVYNLLPRLIEVGPDLLKSEDWKARRTNLKTA